MQFMDNKTIIFFDSSDSNNPGWAWRTRLADGSEESGAIDGPAAECLDTIDHGDQATAEQEAALVGEMQSSGLDLHTTVYYDRTGTERQCTQSTFLEFFSRGLNSRLSHTSD